MASKMILPTLCIRKGYRSGSKLPNLRLLDLVFWLSVARIPEVPSLVRSLSDPCDPFGHTPLGCCASQNHSKRGFILWRSQSSLRISQNAVFSRPRTHSDSRTAGKEDGSHAFVTSAAPLLAPFPGSSPVNAIYNRPGPLDQALHGRKAFGASSRCSRSFIVDGTGAFSILLSS